MFSFCTAPRAPLAVRSRYSHVLLGALAAISLPSVCAQTQTTLSPVIVTATRTPENAADLPFGVSVLTADDIKASGVTTVNAAIMKLLGVPGRLDFYGGGDYALDLRGFGGTADNNQVVVVDGIRINEADLGGTRLAGISIDSVERIEVIRGSGAVLYGEGATGGVIVVTTKAGKGVARQTQADAYVAVGRYDTRDMRGTATVVAGQFSLDVGANRRESDNHRDNFHSTTDGASVTGQWSNDWLRVGVRNAYDHLKTGLPGSLSTAQYHDDPRQTNTPQDSARIRNTRTSVFGEAVLGEWRVGLDAGWRDKSLSSKSSSGLYAYDVDASTYALHANHATHFGSIANSLIVGFDHGDWKRLNAFGSKATQRSNAFYVKDEVMLFSGTRLSAGWRTESVDKDNSDATTKIDQRPRAWEVGFVQPVGGGVSLFGRIGHSFRLANADEFSYASPGKLKTQSSRDTELGGRWSHATGRVELRLYRSALNNEIGFDPSAVNSFGGLGANVNYDHTRREGVELEVAQALTADANLRVNAATRRARFSAGVYDGKDVPLTPRHTLSLRADWSPVQGHRIDGGVNLVSSQHPDFNNECKMPSYTTADLSYSYHWRWAELAVGVNNLTDRRHYTQAFSCVNGAVSAIYPEAGRAVTASLRLHF